MRSRLQGSTSYPITFLMVDSADHVTGKTGLSPSVALSKNGGAFGVAVGTVTELANGWYSWAASTSDRDTLGELAIHISADGADPTDLLYVIVEYDPFDVAEAGDAMALTAAYDAAKTAASQASVDAIEVSVWGYSNRSLTDKLGFDLSSAAINEISTALSAMQIQFIGPMLQGGNAEIVVGDDYLAADGRALSWTITNPPDLAGAEIYFVYGDNSVLATNVDNVISVELTSLQTITMLGSQKFSLIATLVNGHKATLIQGSIIGR